MGQIQLARDKKHARILREKQTLEVMIRIYCKGSHESGEFLCKDCQELLDYANQRIDDCPLIANKPTCLNCKIHCYETPKQEKIRVVMRYAGPRMLSRHPALAIAHLIDGRRKAP
jgi:predicted amidophosphoribosyltransferase